MHGALCWGRCLASAGLTVIRLVPSAESPGCCFSLRCLGETWSWAQGSGALQSWGCGSCDRPG